MVNSYDPKSDIRFGQIDKLRELYDGVRNVLGVPLRNSSNAITGVVQVINRIPESVSFDKDDEQLLLSFAGLVSAIIGRSHVMMSVESDLKQALALNQFYGVVLAALPYVVFTFDSERWVVDIQ